MSEERELRLPSSLCMHTHKSAFACLYTEADSFSRAQASDDSSVTVTPVIHHEQLRTAQLPTGRPPKMDNMPGFVRFLLKACRGRTIFPSSESRRQSIRGRDMV